MLTSEAWTLSWVGITLYTSHLIVFIACLGTSDVVLKHIFDFQCNDVRGWSYMLHTVERLVFQFIRNTFSNFCSWSFKNSKKLSDVSSSSTNVIYVQILPEKLVTTRRFACANVIFYFHFLHNHLWFQSPLTHSVWRNISNSASNDKTSNT